MAIIGIDLGTTNSVASVWKDGESVLIPNSFGEFLTPSVVSLNNKNNIIVGKIAKERLISHPKNTVEHFKRYMGSEKNFNLDSKDFSPEELSSFVLRQLCSDAEKFLGEPITEAVISVPAYFDDRQRSSTKLAGQLAGIHVERIINEPSAAAIAYQKKMNQEGMYLVFDFGGGTLDISVVDVFFNIIDIIAISGNNRLGGQDIDELIVKEFLRKNPELSSTLSPHEIASLHRLAEECKIALSFSNHAFMIYKRDENTYSMELTNQKLSEICTPILAKMQSAIHKALQDAGRSIQELSGVIPVGGSCIMPLVDEYINYITGKKPLKGIDPNLAVGYGIGIVSGIKSRKDGAKDFILSDICPFSLGISVLHEYTNRPYFSCIIPRNTSLPASRKEIYRTIYDNQPKMRVDIYQGESLDLEKNTLLGTVDMNVPPLPEGEANIIVHFTYDINGILEVDVYCPQNDTSISTTIIKNDSLSADEIQKKVLELATLKNNEQENNIDEYLLAKGERLFTEHSGYMRDIIANHIFQYKSVLESNPNPTRLKKVQKQIDEFFSEIDNFEDGLTDFPSFLDLGDEANDE